MATSKKTNTNKLKYGKVGDTKLVTRNGKQYYRKAHNTMTVHRNTEGQFLNRMAFANCINLWKCLVASNKPYYSEKRSGSSDYNCFMTLNCSLSKSFLPKNVIEAGGCAAPELVLSDGSLPPITLTQEGNIYRSNIVIGDLQIGSTTPRSAISRAIVEHNQGFSEGDTIRLLLLTEYEQLSPADVVVPMVELNKVDLVLDFAAEDSQWDCLFMSRQGEECLFFVCDTVGRCLVHLHDESGKLMSSPAALQFGSRSEIYKQTLDAEARELALLSYDVESSSPNLI